MQSGRWDATARHSMWSSAPEGDSKAHGVSLEPAGWPGSPVPPAGAPMPTVSHARIPSTQARLDAGREGPGRQQRQPMCYGPSASRPHPDPPSATATPRSSRERLRGGEVRRLGGGTRKGNSQNVSLPRFILFFKALSSPRGQRKGACEGEGDPVAGPGDAQAAAARPPAGAGRARPDAPRPPSPRLTPPHAASRRPAAASLPPASPESPGPRRGSRSLQRRRRRRRLRRRPPLPWSFRLARSSSCFSSSELFILPRRRRHQRLLPPLRPHLAPLHLAAGGRRPEPRGAAGSASGPARSAHAQTLRGAPVSMCEGAGTAAPRTAAGRRLTGSGAAAGSGLQRCRPPAPQGRAGLRGGGSRRSEETGVLVAPLGGAGAPAALRQAERGRGRLSLQTAGGGLPWAGVSRERGSPVGGEEALPHRSPQAWGCVSF